ncbi:MAG: DNA mismatch repair endonuclease MutL [Bacilli bacterium]|nr:DNA mismatch repair endonuclease MutL [Bacilli bacterium]MDD3896171.1 DNA mismatch repair endonuclease MutL [Bacilli bacterium]
MNKIKIMSENLANKIAAGEVVERISNVVKELVENSLDAGAKNIKIELINSGTKMIKVIDDGSGMNNIDARNAFLRHATSKIYKEDDLFFINSLGFRGEALPSIASVSKVTLSTSQGDQGTTIKISGGKFEEEFVSDARCGTIIEVNDLFYNTPARLKYLKSEQTELANTTNYIEKLALSYNSVAFELINNHNTIIKTSGQNNLLKTIHEIYGLDISKNMLELKGSNNDFDIYGYISKPSILKSTRNYITTIVNGRVVKNLALNKIINDAYHTYKPDNKYPIIILLIETDPTLIDVNIHPTKQDIKFSKINSLEDLVFSSIKDTLYNSLLIPKIEVKTKDYNNEIKIKTSYPEIEKPNEEVNEVQESFNFKEENNKIIKELELYPCGLVFGTYIVAQNDNAMYLIDEHAAQERINYEKILKYLSQKEINTIALLIPINIELSPSDYLLFNENKHLLENMGFIIDEIGINTITIKTHPIWLISGYEIETINKIIELVINLPKDFDMLKFNDKLAATAACKASVKGNTNITFEEMESILSNLVKCDNPYNCPHGRPTIISFTKYELEKMFKRVIN